MNAKQCLAAQIIGPCKRFLPNLDVAIQMECSTLQVGMPQWLRWGNAISGTQHPRSGGAIRPPQDQAPTGTTNRRRPPGGHPSPSSASSCDSRAATRTRMFCPPSDSRRSMAASASSDRLLARCLRTSAASLSLRPMPRCCSALSDTSGCTHVIRGGCFAGGVDYACKMMCSADGMTCRAAGAMQQTVRGQAEACMSVHRADGPHLLGTAEPGPGPGPRVRLLASWHVKSS